MAITREELLEIQLKIPYQIEGKRLETGGTDYFKVKGSPPHEHKEFASDDEVWMHQKLQWMIFQYEKLMDEHFSNSLELNALRSDCSKAIEAQTNLLNEVVELREAMKEAKSQLNALQAARSTTRKK